MLRKLICLRGKSTDYTLIRHLMCVYFFIVCRKCADIAPLLDVEDMVRMQKPDWKCVFTYVQSLYRKLHTHERNKTMAAGGDWPRHTAIYSLTHRNHVWSLRGKKWYIFLLLMSLFFFIESRNPLFTIFFFSSDAKFSLCSVFFSGSVVTVN